MTESSKRIVWGVQQACRSAYDRAAPQEVGVRLKRSVLCIVTTMMMACAGERPPRAAFDPVTEDPAVIDRLNPALNRMVEIPSGGSRMSGVLFIASGSGPHPTVILLHGFPGHAGLRDIAEAIRRAGWNVLTFQYRGMHGRSDSTAHVVDLS